MAPSLQKGRGYRQRIRGAFDVVEKVHGQAAATIVHLGPRGRADDGRQKLQAASRCCGYSRVFHLLTVVPCYIGMRLVPWTILFAQLVCAADSETRRKSRTTNNNSKHFKFEDCGKKAFSFTSLFLSHLLYGLICYTL